MLEPQHRYVLWLGINVLVYKRMFQPTELLDQVLQDFLKEDLLQLLQTFWAIWNDSTNLSVNGTGLLLPNRIKMALYKKCNNNNNKTSLCIVSHHLQSNSKWYCSPHRSWQSYLVSITFKWGSETERVQGVWPKLNGYKLEKLELQLRSCLKWKSRGLGGLVDMLWTLEYPP